MQSLSRWKTVCWILAALSVNIGFVLGELKLSWFILALIAYSRSWMGATLGMYLIALLYILTLSFNSFICGLAFSEPVSSKRLALIISFLPVVPIFVSLLWSWFPHIQ